MPQCSKPGGGYDTYSRLLQPFLAKELRATIVVENRSDAGGLVAAAAIRDATPDGRTIGIINAAGLLARIRRINNLLDKDPPLVSSEIISGGAANTYETYDLFGREIFIGVTVKL